MSEQTSIRHGELGGARAKFIIVMAIVGALFFAGYHYIPVAYEAYRFKDLMQTKVDAAATMGRDAAWVREQLVKSEVEYNIPQDAVITASMNNAQVEVRVQYVRPIAIPGYTYNYEFDQTVKSGTFLTK